MLDINQNARTGTFNTSMMEIRLKNAFETRNHGTIPATHHRGSQPISAICHSATLDIARTGILPIEVGVSGNHRNIYADFSSSSFLGQRMYLVANNSTQISSFKLNTNSSPILTKTAQAHISNQQTNLETNTTIKNNTSKLNAITKPQPKVMPSSKTIPIFIKLSPATSPFDRTCSK